MWLQAWPPLELKNQRDSLRSLEKLVSEQRPEVKDEVNQVLARFLVVRSCGYLEQVSERCCLLYLNSKTSHPMCQSFNGTWFGRGRNPNPEALISFVKRFDLTLATNLEELFTKDDHYLSREVSFLVDRRNKISHGQSEGIGTMKALKLVEPTIEIADWFINNFDPR